MIYNSYKNISFDYILNNHVSCATAMRAQSLWRITIYKIEWNNSIITKK